jgi:hypothetical protein
MPRFRRTYSIDPTTWQVSFRMLKPHMEPGDEGRTARRRSPRKSREPLARRRSRPFAYRIEALRRAIKYREDYVVRFARRLTRLANANRAANPHGADDQLASGPVGELIGYLPRSLVAALDLILWTAKYAEPG